MSRTQHETTELKSQYAAQLAGDLENNAKEQERIGAESAALQEQLRGLQRDQALLVVLQQALDTENTAATGPRPEDSVTTATAPSKSQPASAEPKLAEQKDTVATTPKTQSAVATTSRKKTAKGSSTKTSTTAAKPTLVELIHGHLSRGSDPHSAAELTSALSEAHPDRTIKATVVRTTVEGLVAKGRAQRTKQGSSVYYTAS